MSSTSHEAVPLKVLLATPECAPLVKTGGLGDVSASLPPALRALGLDARVLLPGYPAVLAGNPGAKGLGSAVVLGKEVRLLEGTLPTGVPLLIIDCPALFARNGGPYQSDDGSDWADNALRFGVLSRMAALLGSAHSPIAWRPDVVHAHDWPAALAPVYLHFDMRPRAASLITIHNLAFQGVFEFSRIAGLELPAESLGTKGLEFYGRHSFLKGGLVYADAISTVSPTYAREIQGEELGFGMDGVLRERSDRLHGVLNGIDTVTWDPEHDAHIPSRYGARNLEAKRPNKAALRERLGLGGDGGKPLMAMVTRLTHQKGIDIVVAAAERILALGAQFTVCGTGDKELVGRLRGLQARHPQDVGLSISFDEPLAHLIEAGADIFLMPSRFEPCGMNQMYSQRYGTPPIANATGGLVDTVFDEHRAVDVAPTGFLMNEATPEALLEACSRAISAFRDPAQWRALQLNGMSRDFGWAAAALKYQEIYEKLVSDTN
ncbi:MAG: glycogen synthase GlgA [Usitatibacter sp.]